MVDEIDLRHANRFTAGEQSLETMQAEMHRIGAPCKFLESLGKALKVVGMNRSDRESTPIRQSFGYLISARLDSQLSAWHILSEGTTAMKLIEYGW